MDHDASNDNNEGDTANDNNDEYESDSRFVLLEKALAEIQPAMMIKLVHILNKSIILSIQEEFQIHQKSICLNKIYYFIEISLMIIITVCSDRDNNDGSKSADNNPVNLGVDDENHSNTDDDEYERRFYLSEVGSSVNATAASTANSNNLDIVRAALNDTEVVNGIPA
ncbi:hypothetical protein BDA99DRAFT_531562 [Phascolomyces articulosus]|uniref:Uncharacterized protein n=1 Tax=Phascolomyces articulosus TaxID=60185 RepID=A0AAD5KCL4_9FUNG|nr:hypothetical protein BDA99DRAFT_531562 [Phascolomyces articulosus]